MVNNNLLQESTTRKLISRLGCYTVIEYEKDISVRPESAQSAFFMGKMGCRKRQVVCDLNNQGVILQSGAMQIISGNVNMNTNVHGAGDLFKKMIGGKVTGESGIKPRYFGVGQVLLEPTYKYILLEDLSRWGGAVTIEDGLFLACDDTVNLTVTSRANFSSAALGGEGLFNTTLTGSGVAVLESPVPAEELLVFDLQNDVLKIDGNMAIAWSHSLQFTVEKSTRSLVGSAASGEGLVNVYRGTGRVLVAPIA